MATSNKNKKKILCTPVNQLVTSIKITGYAARNSWTVMTTQEVFNANQSLKANKEVIKCFKDADGNSRGSFIKDSKKWRALRNVLLENGFTHKDWLMLLPETGNPKYFDISLLSKTQLMKLPFRQVCEMKPSGLAYCALADFIHPETNGTVHQNREDHEEFLNIAVHELLKIGYEEAEKIINAQGTFGMNSKDAITFRKALYLAQEKLVKYGFTMDDGSFMKAYFDKPYKNQMAHLTRNKGFTYSAAKKAIEIGKKAGWI